jgi:hypothetical protein
MYPIMFNKLVLIGPAGMKGSQSVTFMKASSLVTIDIDPGYRGVRENGRASQQEIEVRDFVGAS